MVKTVNVHLGQRCFTLAGCCGVGGGIHLIYMWHLPELFTVKNDERFHYLLISDKCFYFKDYYAMPGMFIGDFDHK